MISSSSSISILRRRCSSSEILTNAQIPLKTFSQTRSVSTSPYGRTHVWKRRLPVLPKPMVPKFPQRVLRADGSSFTHWVTSPRSQIALPRDTTNNPMYNTGMWALEGVEEEEGTTGRLGRFNRKFEGITGTGDWLDEVTRAAGGGTAGELLQNPDEFYKKKKKAASKSSEPADAATSKAAPKKK